MRERVVGVESSSGMGKEETSEGENKEKEGDLGTTGPMSNGWYSLFHPFMSVLFEKKKENIF